MIYWYSIVVQTPAHSPLAGLLTYQSEELLEVGSFVRVPLGSRELLGVVWRQLDSPPEPMLSKQGKEIEVKAITAGLGSPLLPALFGRSRSSRLAATAANSRCFASGASLETSN
jgi:primosomal protein N'